MIIIKSLEKIGSNSYRLIKKTIHDTKQSFGMSEFVIKSFKNCD